ncbi:MAG: hypothetical protein J0G95_17870 [Rhizobiales bacterium]|nr:hypothetical protein [Hyphomicrobiales bacterium]
MIVEITTIRANVAVSLALRQHIGRIEEILGLPMRGSLVIRVSSAQNKNSMNDPGLNRKRRVAMHRLIDRPGVRTGAQTALLANSIACTYPFFHLSQ